MDMCGVFRSKYIGRSGEKGANCCQSEIMLCSCLCPPISHKVSSLATTAKSSSTSGFLTNEWAMFLLYLFSGQCLRAVCSGLKMRMTKTRTKWKCEKVGPALPIEPILLPSKHEITFMSKTLYYVRKINKDMNETEGGERFSGWVGCS